MSKAAKTTVSALFKAGLQAVRARSWRSIAWVGAAVVIAFLGVAVRSRWVQQQWEEMLIHIRAVQAEVDARPSARPVLWGIGETGNAFKFYLEAEQDVIRVTGDSDGETWAALVETGGIWTHSRNDSAHSRAAAITILQRLSKGTHQSDSRRRIDWRTDSPSQWCREDLLNLGLSRVRYLVKTRQGEAAVRTALDLLQYGRDLLDDPDFVVAANGQKILLSVVDLFLKDPSAEAPERGSGVEIDNLSDHAIEILEDGLAKLDRPLVPLRYTVLADAFVVSRNLNPGAVSGVASISCLQAVRVLLRIADSVPAPGTPWTSSRSALLRLDREVVSDSVLKAVIGPSVWSYECVRRYGVAGVRMLRVAVVRNGGRGSKLEDPFGTWIRVSRVGGRTTYWSCGRDGKDDLGDPARDFVRQR